MKFRNYICAIFILIQIGAIVYSRFTSQRFFCWAPYDIHTKFEATAIIKGKFFSANELKKRYKYKMAGWEQRSIYNVFSIIKQYETTYGKNDNAHVKVKYSINGYPERIWEFNQ